MSAVIKHNKFNRMSRYDGSYGISLYIIHANLRFVWEKPYAKRGEVEVCISRTKRRLACRNQPPLNTLMSDKSTDMHFTARVH